MLGGNIPRIARVTHHKHRPLPLTAIAGACLLLLLWWQLRGDETAPRTAPTNSSPVGTSAPETSALPPPAAPERVAVAPAATDAPELPDWLAQPFEIAIEAQTSGSTGPSINDWGAFVAPPGSNTVRIMGSPHAKQYGSRVFRFRARQPALEVVVATGHLRRIQVRAEQTNRIYLNETLGANDPVDENGEPPPPPPPTELGEHFNPTAFADFARGIETQDFTEWWDSASFGSWRSTQPKCSLRVRVRDPLGYEAPDAHVVVCSGAATADMIERHEGSAVIANLYAGTYQVLAWAPNRGFVQQEVTIRGPTTELELQLQLGACVRGRVVDARANPIARARVLWKDDFGQWRNDVLTDEHGQFVLANLPPGPGSVWACVDDRNAKMPAAGLRAVLPDSAEVSLTIERDTCHGALRVSPQLAADIPPAHLTARIWHVESGLGLHLQDYDETATTRSARDLPAGHYDVDYGTPEIGWHSAGRHFVDGIHLTDLGGISTPEPARVRFVRNGNATPMNPTLAAPSLQLEVVELRRELNLAIPTPTLDGSNETLLPAGEYAVAWRTEANPWHFRRFSAKAGEHATIELQP
jgi:hypothetical protein